MIHKVCEWLSSILSRGTNHEEARRPTRGQRNPRVDRYTPEYDLLAT